MYLNTNEDELNSNLRGDQTEPESVSILLQK